MYDAGGRIEGDIRINGHPKVQATFARVSGYVEQTGQALHPAVPAFMLNRLQDPAACDCTDLLMGRQHDASALNAALHLPMQTFTSPSPPCMRHSNSQPICASTILPAARSWSSLSWRYGHCQYAACSRLLRKGAHLLQCMVAVLP